MTMRRTVSSCDDLRWHHRRLGLRRRRASAPVRRPPRPRGGAGHRRHPGRRLVAELYPSLAAAYPDLVFEPYEPGSATGSTWSSSACPTARRRTSCPSCAAGSAASSTWPPTSACTTPRSTRSGTARRTPPRAAGRVRLRHARAVPRRTSRAPRPSPPPAATRRRRPRPGAAGAGRAHRADRHRRRRRQRGVGRRPGAQADDHFNTVDEDFTAYGLLDHRHTPEIEQASASRPASAAGCR